MYRKFQHKGSVKLYQHVKQILFICNVLSNSKLRRSFDMFYSVFIIYLLYYIIMLPITSTNYDIFNEHFLGIVGCNFLFLYKICRYACPAITNILRLYLQNSDTTEHLIVNQTPVVLPSATR